MNEHSKLQRLRIESAVIAFCSIGVFSGQSHLETSIIVKLFNNSKDGAQTGVRDIEN
jgi:hypothetical protein